MKDDNDNVDDDASCRETLSVDDEDKIDNLDDESSVNMEINDNEEL